MSKSPSLRRIQADIRELSLDPSDQYCAAPLENDMFEWHFTIRGAPDTDFAGGIYHGRILLPPEYPFKPPHIIFLTPSGRFETNTKICLSFSAFHPELWQPAWGIRLILEALISFLPSPADGAIGALDWSPTERKKLAEKSKDFCCPLCGKVADLMPTLKEGSNTKSRNRFQKEIEQLQRLQTQAQKMKGKKDDEEIEKDEPPLKSPAIEPTLSENAVPLKGTTVTDTTESALPDAEQSPIDSLLVLPAVEETEEGKVEQMTLLAEESMVVSAVASSVAENPPPVPETPIPETPGLVPTENVPPPLNEAVNDQQNKPSWLAEPVLQLAIIMLCVICFLLLRKIQALCAELQALEAY